MASESDIEDEPPHTPSQEAIFSSDMESLEAILAAVDVNARDEGGATLLHYALQRQASNPDVVRFLLQHGADPNVQPLTSDTTAGWTSLHYCASNSKAELAAMLLDAGAEVDAREFETIPIVLDAGIAVESTTPLLQCFKKYHPVHTLSIVIVLLSRGADPYQRDETGNNAYTLVMNLCHREPPQLPIYSLLCNVRSAGGWRKYANEPRARLLLLRTLTERGRATPPRGDVLARLFETRSRHALPPPVFFHVLTFWRTVRDAKY